MKIGGGGGGEDCSGMQLGTLEGAKGLPVKMPEIIPYNVPRAVTATTFGEDFCGGKDFVFACIIQ
jgi:hypothetical protein